MSKFTKWDLYDSADEAHVFGSSSIEPGAYPLRIIAIEDVPDKEYIIVKFDIADGEHKGMFGRFVKNDIEKWPYDAQDIRSYKDTAMPFFKAFITAIEKSNAGYTFRGANGDFQSLVGKAAVGVFANMEIPVPDEDNDLKPKVRVKFYQWRSGPAWREGKIEIPTKVVELSSDYDINKFEEALDEYMVKEVPEKTYHAPAQVYDDSDLPF